jgi:hypothetical protein
MYESGVNDLDLLILVSAGVVVPDTKALKIGGYALVVDGAEKVYSLVRKIGAKSDVTIASNI